MEVIIMKNKDLIVNGIPAQDFIPEEISDHEQLLEFEFASYNALEEKHGVGYCDQHDINLLADVYGQEFSDRVYRQRVKISAYEKLMATVAEIDRLSKAADHYRRLFDNPTPKLDDIFNY